MKLNGLSNVANNIQRYLWCGHCLRSGKQPHLEVGLTNTGFQVWCKTHQVNVVEITVEKPMPIPPCQCCTGGVHHEPGTKPGA